MASFIPLIVGSIFFALGVNFLFYLIAFKKSAQLVTGHVKAIEKYTSTHRQSGHRTQNVYFRPMVEYSYNDTEHITFGASTNEIRHTLNQNVPVMVQQSQDGQKISARIQDPIDIFAGLLFMLMGMGGLAAYITVTDGSWIVALVISGICIVIARVLSNMKLKFNNKFIQTDDNETLKQGSVVIQTKSDFVKEVSSHAFWGGLITCIFMIGAIWIIYSGYTDLPTEAQSILSNAPQDFARTLTSGDMPTSWEKPIMIIGIGCFFFLACLRSIFYLRKKYGRLVRM